MQTTIEYKMDDLDLLLADLDRPKSITKPTQVPQPVPSSNPPPRNTFDTNDINSEIQSIIDELDSQPSITATTTVTVKQPSNNTNFTPVQPVVVVQEQQQQQPTQQVGGFYQNENLQDAGDDLDQLMESLNSSISTALKSVPTPEESQRIEEQTFTVSVAKPSVSTNQSTGVVTSSASLSRKPNNNGPNPTQPSFINSQNNNTSKAHLEVNNNGSSRPVSALSTDDLDELLKNLTPQQPSVVTVPPPVNQAQPKPTTYTPLPQQQQQPTNNYNSTSSINVNTAFNSNPKPSQPTQNNNFKPTQPTSKTSATPNKVLQGDDLDNLLNNLTSQINDIDSSGPTSRGTCGSCKKPIFGETIQAMGKFYHPEHFTCSNCVTPLGTRNFYEQEGMPHCEKCYQELFCARCAHCDEPISDRCITALGKKWHIHHFVCTQCLKPFDSGNFFERDGRPYCESDFYSTFSSRCGGCNQPIRGECINALGTQWHPEHFCCQYCQKSFSGGTFYEYNGKPYCELHYHHNIGSVCAGCGKAVSGRCVDALDKKWHPEHFVCSFCMNPLAGGAYTANNNKPYCKTCHSKLFN